MIWLLTTSDREEALKDDFHLESGNYGFDDEDDEWNEDESNWDTEEPNEEDTGDAKDGNDAYLEFLHEEVCGDLPNLFSIPHPFEAAQPGFLCKRDH